MQRIIVLALSLALSACVDLGAVRDYAGESARLTTDYTTLTDHYRDTFVREAPYLDGATLDAARAADAKRQAAYPDLLRIQDTVSHYLATLATLSGDDTFKLTGSGSVAAQIKAHPVAGLDAQQVSGIAELANLTAGTAASFWQQRAVRDTLRAGEAPFQTSIGAMRHLLDLYSKTLENERHSVLDPFEAEFELADAGATDASAPTLKWARIQYRDKTAEYDRARQNIDAAIKALDIVAAGHTRLVENADDLSKRELVAALKVMSKDIRTVRKQLQAF